MTWEGNAQTQTDVDEALSRGCAERPIEISPSDISFLADALVLVNRHEEAPAFRVGGTFGGPKLYGHSLACGATSGHPTHLADAT